MVANDLDPAAVADPDREIAIPQSVVSLYKGELGSPPGAFPPALQRKVLAGEAPLAGRPGASLAPVDLEVARLELEKGVGRTVTDTDLASSTMYPKVFREYAAHRSHYGDVSRLPTPAFFYGLVEGQEVAVELEYGKTLLIELQGQTEVSESGEVKIFFELNGQSRVVRVAKAGAERVAARPLAETGNAAHVGAPMPGMIVAVAVNPGQKVRKGDPLLSIEAMKMETQIRAEFDATILQVHARRGASVEAHELLVTVEPH
jgi:pyruvate carboxylase